MPTEELYLDKGILIPQEEWEAAVKTIRHAVLEELKHERTDGEKNNERHRQEWQRIFAQAVLERVEDANEKGHTHIGVLFSGGIDSTLIAHTLHKLGIPFTCYTVGFQEPGTKEPEDIVESRRIAAAFGWRLVDKIYTLDELAPIIEQTIHILGDTANTVTVGVGAVVIAGARLATQEGTHVLFGGLGSEELFAGYKRHEHVQNRDGNTGLDDECWRGLSAMYACDLVRDSKVATALGIIVPTPFLDPAVIKLSMLLPATSKIRDGQRKVVLREMSIAMGLPEVFALRPKRAAQYGSRVDTAIEQEAKRRGFSAKEEYIQHIARTENTARKTSPTVDAPKSL